MTNIDPLLREAENYLTQADVDRAAELYKRAYAIDRAGRSPMPAIGMARIAIILGQPDDARKILDATLRRFPGSVHALTFIGVAEESRGDLEAALHWLSRAIKVDETFALAYFNLARVLGQMKLWDDARRAARKAVELDPSRHQFHYALGTIAFQGGDLAGAVTAFSDCLKVDPSQLDTYATLADVLVEAGQPEVADDLLANALTRFPTAGVLYSKRAAVALRRGDYESAQRHSSMQAKVDAKNEEAHLTEAMLHSSLLDFAGAESAARRALAINPKSWRAYFQLGALCEAQGQKDKAKDAYKKAVASGATEWKPLNNLANLLMEDGAAREAKPLLEKACATGPQSQTFLCRYNLALAHWMLGDKEASEQAAREAVQFGPDGHATVENARRFLENFR